ncbi:hypothetical protein BDR05DRAFT_943401 [Suillus weaverae]|nr:hypothetical protein BDR05DRAFT_943401 [Suillus weaverae]
MPAARWTSDVQMEWLQECLPQYLTEHMKEKDYSHFWPTLIRDWFKQFPEEVVVFPNIAADALSPEQHIEVGEAENRCKIQLRTWFCWHANASKKNHSLKKESTVFNDVLQPKRRAKSEAELYSDIYYDKWIKLLVKAKEEAGKVSLGRQIALGCKFSKELLNDEDEEVKIQICDMYEKQWKTHERSGKKNFLDEDTEDDCVPFDAEGIAHLYHAASDKRKPNVTVGNEDMECDEEVYGEEVPDDHDNIKEDNDIESFGQGEEKQEDNEGSLLLPDASLGDASDTSGAMPDASIGAMLPILPHPNPPQGTPNSLSAVITKPITEKIILEPKATQKPKAASKPKPKPKAIHKPKATTTPIITNSPGAESSSSGDAAPGGITNIKSMNTCASKHVPVKSRRNELVDVIGIGPSMKQPVQNGSEKVGKGLVWLFFMLPSS